MYILELIYPGTWLVINDPEERREVESLLTIIESQFTEASIALNLFELEQQKPFIRPDPMAWSEDDLRRREIAERIIQEEKIDWRVISQNAEVQDRIELELRREKWKRGQLPHEYQHHFPFLYAKLFLFALDSIRKCLFVLDKQADRPEEIHLAKLSFDDAFPDLRGVRDSTAHQEDRGRGLGKREKPLEKKPVVNYGIHAPNGGVLVLNFLNGNRFGSTMEDGYFGEVEVSINSLLIVRDCIQRIINSFEWHGPKRFYPI